MDMAKPIIRFKGYQDDWEQRKLSELLVERNVQHSQSEEFPLVSFTVENGVTPKTERYEREQLVRGDKSAKKYKETRLDDIVYNPANLKFGAISRNKLGNAVFSPIYVTFEVKKDLVKPSFIEMVVTRKNFIQKALQYQQGTVYERMAVNTEDFTNLDVYIPNGFEQEKIGNYFENLDHLITLHQRKCDETKRLKKYMLQKMFPQNGEKVPEIRFSGFTDDWEQRKLGDLTEELSEYATMASGLPLLTSSRSGLMYQSDFRDRKTTTSDETLFSIVPKGSCTYRHMSDDDIFHLNINVLEKGLVSREYPVFISSENNDLEFIIQHINSSDRFRAFCKGQKKGGTRTRLYYKTLCEFEMMIPSIEEQKKISATLHSLDYLITLHQRELENLQNIKKFMLGKMFV